MRHITRGTLEEILKQHGLWLKNKGGERADLCNTNLLEADLCGVNLHGADLRGADFCGADLCGVNLCGADLYRANLCEANLNGADLHGADLCDANLCEANLYGANLYRANLCGANLCRADLCGANLSGANLYEADLTDIVADENTAGYWPVCPEKGEFIAYKKAFGCIVELLVPAEAKRSSATSRKCRCEFAKVLSITCLDGSTYEGSVFSNRGGVQYTVDKMVYPDAFDEDRWNECSHGIHFFMTRQEAVNWALQR